MSVKLFQVFFLIFNHLSICSYLLNHTSLTLNNNKIFYYHSILLLLLRKTFFWHQIPLFFFLFKRLRFFFKIEVAFHMKNLPTPEAFCLTKGNVFRYILYDYILYGSFFFNWFSKYFEVAESSGEGLWYIIEPLNFSFFKKFFLSQLFFRFFGRTFSYILPLSFSIFNSFSGLLFYKRDMFLLKRGFWLTNLKIFDKFFLYLSYYNRSVVIDYSDDFSFIKLNHTFWPNLAKICGLHGFTYYSSLLPLKRKSLFLMGFTLFFLLNFCLFIFNYLDFIFTDSTKNRLNILLTPVSPVIHKINFVSLKVQTFPFFFIVSCFGNSSCANFLFKHFVILFKRLVIFTQYRKRRIALRSNKVSARAFNI